MTTCVRGACVLCSERVLKLTQVQPHRTHIAPLAHPCRYEILLLSGAGSDGTTPLAYSTLNAALHKVFEEVGHFSSEKVRVCRTRFAHMLARRNANSRSPL